MESHFIVSAVKSCIRIIFAVISIILCIKGSYTSSIATLSIGLILSEILGVVEELVDTRR